MAEENDIGKNKEGLTGEVKDMKYDYKAGGPGMAGAEIPEEVQKNMKKTKQELENLKKKIVKKYPFTIAIGIIPPQACEKFEEEERVPDADKKEKPIHLIVLIPEEKFKNIKKISADLIKEAKDMKPKVWIHVKTPVDVFNYCLDGKYDLASAIAMSFPLYDKGFLGSLRVAEIHKSLVLRKFEKYVTSYVIAGSLVRGESTKTSDVDIYVIIDDTDVKRMPRLELKEKLRSIIYSYVVEASELAGVKNKLSPQIYILTDFWESVKDAHPVIFTFIRDGIPLYDKGAFMPWKLLLKMGKIKPSPEAIDMFMSMGDKTKTTVERRLTDLIIGDIYWGVITPSQALLMLYGISPPTPKETISEMKKIFVEKEKMLEKKYLNILEKIVGIYKDFEHGKIKDGDFKGQDVDDLLKDFQVYMKRLKELREQIEKRVQEKTIEQIHKDVFQLLQGIFGKKSEAKLIEDFEKQFIKKGKLPENYLGILKDVVKARQEFKKGKMARNEVEDARKNATLLINELIEYGQRCEFVSLQRGKMRIKAKSKVYELVFAAGKAFLIDKGKIKKITNKLEDSDIKELNEALAKQAKEEQVKVDNKIFDVLKKELGAFEIVL